MSPLMRRATQPPSAASPSRPCCPPHKRVVLEQTHQSLPGRGVGTNSRSVRRPSQIVAHIAFRPHVATASQSAGVMDAPGGGPFVRPARSGLCRACGSTILLHGPSAHSQKGVGTTNEGSGCGLPFHSANPQQTHLSRSSEELIRHSDRARFVMERK